MVELQLWNQSWAGIESYFLSLSVANVHCLLGEHVSPGKGTSHHPLNAVGKQRKLWTAKARHSSHPLSYIGAVDDTVVPCSWRKSV